MTNGGVSAVRTATVIGGGSGGLAAAHPWGATLNRARFDGYATERSAHWLRPAAEPSGSDLQHG
jgi:hypothetical protein